MGKIMNLDRNRYVVLRSFSKLGGCENGYRLDAEIVLFNQYTRRKAETQYEISTERVYITIDVPNSIPYEKHDDYLERYWFDFMRNGGINRPTSSVDANGNERKDKYVLYSVSTPVDRSFDSLKSMYFFTCVNYNLLPSTLDLTYAIKSRDGEWGVLASYNYLQCKSEL